VAERLRSRPFGTPQIDHFDWSRYDTRHVVFEPEHMTREQVMDGYIWLYEEAYTSDRALRRLERFWSQYRKKPSTTVENLFIWWKTRGLRDARSKRFQRFFDESWKRLWKRGLNSEVGQLLYYLDSADFLDYRYEFRSVNYYENVKMFRGEVAAPTADAILEKKQWERAKKLPAKTAV
jgi:hypothetical protein